MLFNSLDYLIFFISCYIIYWLSPRNFRKYILILFSLVFYAYWSKAFLFHFFAFIVLTHFAVIGILKTKKKIFLILGVGINLANLIFFKYILTYLQYIIKEESAHFPFSDSITAIALPLAISFYTFQMIAYIMDAWRGKFNESPFLDFVLFILFFPQLIAGPIMRHDDFYNQIDNAKLNWDYVQRGFYHLISGIIKKVLIADQMAKLINPVWNDPAGYDGFSIVLAVLGFSVQVFCDFSGYTDFARGSAFLLGYEIPENFKAPYFSVSFSELWTRWHITLSTWIRDYLYIPLGGNKVSETRFKFNTILVMSLGGLWHGNTYTFFFWGLLHGILLGIERSLFGKVDRKNLNLQKKIFGFIIVTIFWLIGASFFRAENFEKLILLWSNSLNLKGNIIYKPDFWILVFACYSVQFIEFKNYFSPKFENLGKWLVPVLSIIVYFALVKIETQVETFIYFQF